MKTSTKLLLFALATALQAGSLRASTNSDALWYPRFATPAVVALDSAANRQLTVQFRAPNTATGWAGYLINEYKTWNLTFVSANYSATNVNRGTEAGWKVVFSVPTDCSPELFRLKVSCSSYASVKDNAVSVIPAFNTNFYILHQTDEQIENETPHKVVGGGWYTRGCQEQLEWANKFFNLVNPRCVIESGDLYDYNSCTDGGDYANWKSWGYDNGTSTYNYTTQDIYDISIRLCQDFIEGHTNCRVPYFLCPGNHDVPPPSQPSYWWHNNSVPVYETNMGQRSWSMTMGNFYVLMHDYSESSLKTWANNDYTNALTNSNIKFRLISQHSSSEDQYIKPSSVGLMLMGHGHQTKTIQSSPYYIYEDKGAYDNGGVGFFKFNWSGTTWTCDQTTSARNTNTDCFDLYYNVPVGSVNVTNKVRCSASDPYNVTTTSVWITNFLSKNFFDGRVRFKLAKGVYNTCTNGTILSQYDTSDGQNTIVLVKVNILPGPSSTLKVSMGPAAPTNPFAKTSRITLSGYSKTSTLNNFPLLVKLSTGISGFNYNQFASPAGNDIRFFDSNGNMLAHEIGTWDTNGTSLFWVQVPSIVNSGTYIDAYWGNPSLTTVTNFTTNGAAWSGYDYCLHMKETGFPMADSACVHPGTGGVAPVAGSGFFGNGEIFNGTSQYVTLQNSVDVASALGLSAWVKLDSTATNMQVIAATKAGGWNTAGYSLYVNTYNTADGKLIFEAGDGTTGLTASTTAGAVPVNSWHHIFANIDRTAGTAQLYVDGVDKTASGSVCTTFSNNGIVNIGRFTSGTYFDGTIDEIRSEATHSADWVWATYQNGANNGTFMTYGAVVTPP